MTKECISADGYDDEIVTLGREYELYSDELNSSVTLFRGDDGLEYLAWETNFKNMKEEEEEGEEGKEELEGKGKQNKYYELIEFCAKENTLQFNSNKALEEAAEFIEALLKYQTKYSSNKKPYREEILKEYGDFVYRGLILLKVLFPENSIDDILNDLSNHVIGKLDGLITCKEQKMYKIGL